jgi:hypothetical protein
VIELLPIMVHPLAGMTVLAVHRARTRGRRDGAEELFATCPASAQTRNVGHLRTAWVPALTTVLFASLLLSAYLATSGIHWGPIGARQLAQVLGCVLLAVGAVALGVALARWAPWTLAPVVAVLAIGIASVQIATSGDRATDGSRQLSTWLTSPEVAIRFTATHWLAHDVWVLFLVAMTCVLALIRDSHHRRQLGLGLTVLALGAGAVAYVATRPLSATDIERITAMLAAPDAHQACVDAGIPVCVYEGDDALARAFAAAVGPVVAAAPAEAVPAIRLRQGADVDRDRLDPVIVSHVPTDIGDGALPVRMVDVRAAYDGARLWTAFGVTGITGDPRVALPVNVAGQARGVVAIWLATRGLDDNRAARLATTTQRADGTATGPWPDSCYAGLAPVLWALSDLEAARLLLAADDADVRQLVHDRWHEFVDPSTPTDDLLVALGIPPVGGPQGRTPWPIPC